MINPYFLSKFIIFKTLICLLFMVHYSYSIRIAMHMVQLYSFMIYRYRGLRSGSRLCTTVGIFIIRGPSVCHAISMTFLQVFLIDLPLFLRYPFFVVCVILYCRKALLTSQRYKTKQIQKYYETTENLCKHAQSYKVFINTTYS